MERLASVDAAWLRMEEPTNLMMITAVLWFDEPLDWERLKAVVRERLVERFPRFRQRLVGTGGLLVAPYWEEDPAFELEAHLGHAVVPPPGDRDALEQLVSQWMSVPLERSRPLWQFHLVDGFGRGGAVLVRIHHTLADGISLARVLLSLMDESTEEHFTPEPSPREEPPTPGWRKMLRGVRAVASGTRAALKRGAELLAEPIQLGDLVREGSRGAAAVKRLALLSSDPATVLRGELGTAKRAAWSEPIPLEEVKALGRAMESTINDVLLAALTGALRRYLEERGGPVEDLRAMVPVNLRPLDEPIPRELGNRFGLVFLDLPVKEEDPRRRLRALKQRMDVLKRSPEAALTFGMLGMAGLVPVAVERAMVDVLAAKASLIMTNVPGPRHPVFLAGTKLAGLMFWVPQSGKVGLGVSIFSYAGQVTVGVSVDAGLVPDPHRLVSTFRDELAALASAAASPGTAPAPG
ncbi:wax ester/triacylglycerol synthase family O-acyltransferase [Hyalangium sp.]|uniref:WS/DGAT/MGAT family O-acyltransferase n=1 Tax=Hyalangium sp. TaxID=2028555 RepID=UPI002D3E61A2|nr:wax ester/triacylglycerol synthase family O-acyltransferase [Hyalangium sp.]HYH95522.1 wax ester/triacylglycerol synthase family O-acyltransferase [Hyalangium sp.]